MPKIPQAVFTGHGVVVTERLLVREELIKAHQSSGDCTMHARERTCTKLLLRVPTTNIHYAAVHTVRKNAH